MTERLKMEGGKRTGKNGGRKMDINVATLETKSNTKMTLRVPSIARIYVASRLNRILMYFTLSDPKSAPEYVLAWFIRKITR